MRSERNQKNRIYLRQLSRDATIDVIHISGSPGDHGDITGMCLNMWWRTILRTRWTRY